MTTIRILRDDAVAHVRIDRAHRANALDSATLEALASTLEALGRDPELRVVALGAQGRHFCGGADVGEMSGLDPAGARAFIGRIHRACGAIRALPVPVVARLHGAVIGAGLELAAACDLRIASEDARFSMPEVRIGIPSVVEAALLPRLVGAGRAAWLVLTAQAIDARKAEAWGLVEEVAPLHGLDEALGRLLAALLAGEREALRLQKALAQLWDEAPLAESVARSIDRFEESFRSGVPNRRMRKEP